MPILDTSTERLKALRAVGERTGLHVEPAIVAAEGFIARQERIRSERYQADREADEVRKAATEAVFDVIRYFGTRKKIFSVHFRNIDGGFLNFRESFIDNGSVDMLKALRVYKEVGYDGMMMPDHVPQIEGIDSHQGFAYAFGYIKALIAAVSSEA